MLLNHDLGVFRLLFWLWGSLSSFLDLFGFFFRLCSIYVFLILGIFLRETILNRKAFLLQNPVIHVVVLVTILIEQIL